MEIVEQRGTVFDKEPPITVRLCDALRTGL